MYRAQDIWCCPPNTIVKKALFVAFQIQVNFFIKLTQGIKEYKNDLKLKRFHTFINYIHCTMNLKATKT